MALSERNRNILYRGFRDAIGDEEAIEQMLQYFPARDVEEPATKELLQITAGELRVEIEQVRVEIEQVRVEIEQVRTGIEKQGSVLRGEMQLQMRWIIGLFVPMYLLMIAQLTVA